MEKQRTRMVVVVAAGLGHEFAEAAGLPASLAGFHFGKLEGMFPGLTCPVQATLRTALLPTGHGVVANGFFFRDLRRTMFWEQSAGLVKGARTWEAFRGAGGRVGMLFWQQSLGEQADLVLSPAPVHKHHGGMLEAYACAPAEDAAFLASLADGFRLRHYWGPLASHVAGSRIAEATVKLLQDRARRPDALFTYLPTLDYDLQRHGPDTPQARTAASHLASQLGFISSTARNEGYEVCIVGDYAIAACPRGPVFPNRALRAAGLCRVRTAGGMTHLDPWHSRAFAMADHEIAHVYVRDAADLAKTKEVLSGMPGVGRVLGAAEQAALGVCHPSSGELMLVAAEGQWIAYPWWEDPAEAPDYACHVDIHQKPGYDPCELFFGFPPWKTSTDWTRPAGSHGSAGPGRDIFLASSLNLVPQPRTLPGFAAALGSLLAP